tara:strand:+ start:352 stop:918 length:567 start_codon:yes stop_codon:yes gene_type:complete
MTKQTDLLVIEPVPLYDATKQQIDEYLNDLISYCAAFHNEVKDFGFSTEDAKDFFRYMCKNSNEPQYVIFREITIAQSFLKEEGDSLSADTISKVFSELERLKTYVKSVKQKTYQDLWLRAVAEYYYMDGLSVNEIVDTLIALKLLDEYGKVVDIDKAQESLLENHRRRVHRYVAQFKDFDVIRSDSK